ANVDDDDLESAAPELTARLRAVALTLAPGSDPAVDLCLSGGAARFGADGSTLPPWAARLGLRSGVAAAGCAFARASGLLVADHGFGRRRASACDLPLLSQFALVVGHGVERARMLREQLVRRSQLSTLEELGKSTLTATSLRTELALLVRAGTQAL